jgi:hypothetical protein
LDRLGGLATSFVGNKRRSKITYNFDIFSYSIE